MPIWDSAQVWIGDFFRQIKVTLNEGTFGGIENVVPR